MGGSGGRPHACSHSRGSCRDAVAGAVCAVSGRFCRCFWRGQELVLLLLFLLWGHAGMGPCLGDGRVGPYPSARAGALRVMCERGEVGPCAPRPAGCGGGTHGTRVSCVGHGTAGTGRALSRSSRGQSPYCALGHWGSWDTAYSCVQIVHRVCARLGCSRIQGWGRVGCSKIPALTGVWGKVADPRCVPPALGRDRN